MNPSPPATPQPQRVMAAPIDESKMEVALSWLEKCIAIISTLSYSNVAAVLMLLWFIRPTASFFLVLVRDFSQLAAVFLRIVATYAEIAAGVLESVNEKHFRQDATCSFNDDNDNDDVPTPLDNYSKVDPEKQPLTPSRNHERSKMTSASDAKVSAQKKKKKPNTKKALGREKIMLLREKRLKMGLKVASKADAC